MIRSILVAVDFGDASARAVSIAGAIAPHCAATLTLLHAEAVEAPVYFTPAQISALETERRRTRTQAEHYLAEFGRAHTGEPFAAVVDEGAAVEAILRRSRTADLVIMGTHGRRGPTRWWLGSVAERVLRDIDRPLLVVRGDTPAAADAVFHQPVVRVDPPLNGAAATRLADQLGRCFGADTVAAAGRNNEAQPDSIIVAAVPVPNTARWLVDTGEPLVRSAGVPVLFVPESQDPKGGDR